MKFVGGIGCGTGNKHFVGDLDHDADLGIFKTLFTIAD